MMALAYTSMRAEYVGEMASQDAPIRMHATSTLTPLAMMEAVTTPAVQVLVAVPKECTGTGN